MVTRESSHAMGGKNAKSRTSRGRRAARKVMFDPIVSSIGHIRAGQLRSAVEAKTKNEWLRARITRSNTKRKRPARAKARSSAPSSEPGPIERRWRKPFAEKKGWGSPTPLIIRVAPFFQPSLRLSSDQILGFGLGLERADVLMLAARMP